MVPARRAGSSAHGHSVIGGLADGRRLVSASTGLHNRGVSFPFRVARSSRPPACLDRLALRLQLFTWGIESARLRAED
jgi:hypothetical protein